MILESETNLIYFSDINRNDDKYKDAFKRIQSILDKQQINYQFLKSTKDIWCRDYMSIQIDENHFVQFRYEPSYLKGYRHLQSNPKEICESN